MQGLLTMDKGFVIMAQGDDYVTCAKALELSIKRTMPDANVTIITTEMLPYGDQAPDTFWKLQNDWQVYEASPYEYTIKLEADMYLPQSIDYYWDVLKDRDIVVSTNIRNFRQDISDVRYYRRFIDDNNLPDTYNAITYFKKSELAEKFFNIVRDVFENWEEYKRILKCKVDELCTTDWAYAIAAHILGAENTTMPQFDSMTMVHMKQFINGSATENWTDSLIHELFPHTFRINTIPQVYPVHYHVKKFANVILEKFGE
jgi:hypothetical protein